MIKYIEKEINIKENTVLHKYFDIDTGEFVVEKIELEKGKLPIYMWKVDNGKVKDKKTSITVYYDNKYKEGYVSYKALQGQCRRFGAVINNKEFNLKSFYAYEFPKNYIIKDDGEKADIITIFLISENDFIAKEHCLSINKEEPKIDYSNLTKIEPKITESKNDDIQESTVENIEQTEIKQDTVIENIVDEEKENNVIKDDKKESVLDDDDDEEFDIFEMCDTMKDNYNF